MCEYLILVVSDPVLLDTADILCIAISCTVLVHNITSYG